MLTSATSGSQAFISVHKAIVSNGFVYVLLIISRQALGSGLFAAPVYDGVKRYTKKTHGGSRESFGRISTLAD